jgi:hypothetical protein
MVPQRIEREVLIDAPVLELGELGEYVAQRTRNPADR